MAPGRHVKCRQDAGGTGCGRDARVTRQGRGARFCVSGVIRTKRERHGGDGRGILIVIKTDPSDLTGEEKRLGKISYYLVQEFPLILAFFSILTPLAAWTAAAVFSITAGMSIALIPYQDLGDALINLSIFFCMLFALLGSIIALILHLIELEPSWCRCIISLLVVTANIANFIVYMCVQMIFVAREGGYLSPR